MVTIRTNINFNPFIKPLIMIIKCSEVTFIDCSDDDDEDDYVDGDDDNDIGKLATLIFHPSFCLRGKVVEVTV